MATQIVFQKNGYVYVVHIAEMNVACYTNYENARLWLQDFAKKRKLVVSGNVEFWGK